MRAPRVGPWGPKVRGGGAALGAPGVAVEPVSCGVMDSVPPCGGGRGQAASVHLRSGGRDRQAECATAKARRCAPWRTCVIRGRQDATAGASRRTPPGHRRRVFTIFVGRPGDGSPPKNEDADRARRAGVDGGHVLMDPGRRGSGSAGDVATADVVQPRVRPVCRTAPARRR